MFRNEEEFVALIRSVAALEGGHPRERRVERKKGVELGIGDDAALVTARKGHDVILTADMSIEAVHFSRRLHPPAAVGHRALARSLSDVAAMGGVPRYALVSLAISRGVERHWVSEFYGGMQRLGSRFDVQIVGGDTAIVPGRIFIDVLVAGEVPKGKALRRSGARAGDQIYVSGVLGLSALGFHLLKNKGSRLPRSAKAAAREAIQAHLHPEPQCALGRFLSERRLASAAMDLSDGLSTDLARLCAASGVGARLWAAKIPRPELPGAATPLQLALDGGEDYQLLFTVPPRKAPRLPRRFQGRDLHPIGEIEASRGIRLVMPEGKAVRLEPAGWDHFRQAR
jgi:thiamine-monophosphate kinase